MTAANTSSEVAFHEAGHVVIAWLLGRGEEIQHIDTSGNDSNLAFVRFASRRSYPSRLDLIQNLSIDLAGPRASGRVIDDDDWVATLWDSGEGDIEGTDLHSAFRSAMVLRPRSPAKLIGRVASWVEELFSIPRVWSVVVAVAEAVAGGNLIDGRVLVSIMDHSWGKCSTEPICDLGRKWRRRFMDCR